MKKIIRVVSLIIVSHLLISIIYYLGFMISFKIFIKPNLYFLYGWLLTRIKKIDYTTHEILDEYYKISIVWWPILIFLGIVLLVILYLNRKKIIGFVKVKYSHFKQNTKSARIRKLEQELEELKRKSK